MNNSLRQGGNYYSKSSTSNDQPKQNNKDVIIYKYPKGYLPFFLIVLVEITLLLIAFFVSKIQWYDAILIASVIAFCLVCIWLIARQNFATNTKYNIIKHKNKLFFQLFRSRQKSDNYYKFASNNINSLDEYIEFQKIRKQKSKLLFWISFGIQGTFMVTSIILQVIMTTIPTK